MRSAAYISIAMGLASSTLGQQACNGHAEYCTRPWSQVSQVGAHDSAFIGELPTQNQHLSLDDQLNLGIRFLQGQTHMEDDTLELCHTSCFEEDGGSTQEYMGTVKSFLDGHPDEVITLLLTNGDNVDVGKFDDALKASTLDQYVFTPKGSPNILGINDWPTMGDMISSGKRLVFFLDSGADMKRFPYILDEFSYFFETPFDQTNRSFPCTIDRPAGASPDGRMYIANHFLDLSIFGISMPDELEADETNAPTGEGSIGADVDNCKSIYGRFPKGVLLDYVDKGDPMTAENHMNGV